MECNINELPSQLGLAHLSLKQNKKVQKSSFSLQLLIWTTVRKQLDNIEVVNGFEEDSLFHITIIVQRTQNSCHVFVFLDNFCNYQIFFKISFLFEGRNSLLGYEWLLRNLLFSNYSFCEFVIYKFVYKFLSAILKRTLGWNFKFSGY